MQSIASHLDELMGIKGLQEHRRLSYRLVARETGVSLKTIIAIADNSINHYPADALVALCEYFDCTPGDILALHDLPEDKLPPGRRKALERRWQRLAEQC